MATRLTFLCASATASGRAGGFAAPQEPLDDGGLRKAEAYRLRGPRPDHVVTSPSRAAIETAQAIGIEALIEPMLADLDFGGWSGCSFSDVQARDAPTLLAWLADPTGAPPGGETMAELMCRVGAWIDRHATGDRTVLVVGHAAVIRAALSHTLSISIPAAMSFDIAPLGSLVLSRHRRWRLQELRCP